MESPFTDKSQYLDEKRCSRSLARRSNAIEVTPNTIVPCNVSSRLFFVHSRRLRRARQCGNDEAMVREFARSRYGLQSSH